MDTEQIEIKSIKIGRRFRKDMGDIEALAKSIAEVGLLHPIVVDAKDCLIAGRRRIEAARRLGWSKIPVRRIDLDRVVQGEFDENQMRKDFLPSELCEITRALIPVEKEAAAERKKEGQKSGGRGHKKLGVKKTASLDTGEAVVIAAKQAGWSRSSFEKATAVCTAAEGEPEKFGPCVEVMDTKGVAAGYREAVARGLKSKKKSRPIRLKSFDELAAISRVHDWILKEAQKWPKEARHVLRIQLEQLAEEVEYV